MTLAGTATLAVSEAFQPRVTSAIVAAALQISGEEVDTGQTQFAGYMVARQARQALATRVLKNPAGETPAFAWAVAANPVISGAGENAPDTDIEFVIAQVWDDISGAAPLLALGGPYVPVPPAPTTEPPVPTDAG